MRIIRNIIILVIILAIIVIGFFSFYKGSTSEIQPTAKLSKEELITRGEYLAKVGDCAACHTSDKGDFAGGVGLDSGTPVGLIYPSNITPDKETGIGNYTLTDFDNAVRFGLKKSGDALYPAMPYPSFASVASEDVEALYNYFMYAVKPVNNKMPVVSGSWPFSMNWPVNAWRLAFAPEVTKLTAFTSNDPIERGAYLVEGLAHCGTCHTPRDEAMAEVAYKNDPDRRYLSGGATLEGWNAVNLRGDDMDGLGRMSHDELVTLLKSGRNSTSAVFGSMVAVVNDSLQHLTDADIEAIATYIKSLSPVNPNGKKYHYNPATFDALSNGRVDEPGALTYLNNCAGCHRSDGKGYAETFPALAGNSAILNENADSLITLILKGSHMPGTLEAPTEYAMLGYAWRLDNREVADLVNFVRNSWGNSAKRIEAHDVRVIRDQVVTPEMIRYQESEINSVPPYNVQ